MDRMNMLNFALIGAAGYIAPRHMEAIQKTGNILVAALDPHDSVGVLDRYFPQAKFFTEFERFDRHIDKLGRMGKGIDFLSVCSPNYLHDSHVRFGLRSGADVICEKPLVINPWNLDALEDLEREYQRKIYNILQLRLHPGIQKLKETLEKAPQPHKRDIELTYITSRGSWYHSSWKGDIQKSGGIATNIGIHFFDMLLWLFGNCSTQEVHWNNNESASGFLELHHANVRWFLSIDENLLPEEVKSQGKRTFRSLKMQGEEWEFSTGFEDLHHLSYQWILEGKGFALQEARPSIELVHQLRHAPISPISDRAHPLAEKGSKTQPFP
jgi:UDP-N-acetyl-2-amino-2-deoxyglucuronate dehydrogenase